MKFQACKILSGRWRYTSSLGINTGFEIDLEEGLSATAEKETSDSGETANTLSLAKIQELEEAMAVLRAKNNAPAHIDVDDAKSVDSVITVLDDDNTVRCKM